MPARCGSSPLTRGKPGACAPGVGWSGLIPAHAGKTRRLRSSQAGGPVHPRSRGENFLSVIGGSLSPGSSPLTRGKLFYHGSFLFSPGLIPAHAGKTFEPGGQGLATQAHPRSRGENRVVVRVLAALAGSSPLTRGKHLRVRYPAAQDGLIPAHAGKTALLRRAPLSAAAHPRSRGENVVVLDGHLAG